MKRFLLFVSLLGLAFACADIPNKDENGKILINKIQNLCGSNSVCLLLKFNGISCNYKDILQKLNLNEIDNNGCNIGSILDVLDSYNLKSRAVKLTRDELPSRAGNSFIVYQQPEIGKALGHFYVVRFLDDKKLQVIDAPFAPYIMDKSEFLDKEYIIIAPSNQLGMLDNRKLYLIIPIIIILIFILCKKRLN